ncbi:hypothetical protein JMM81_21165 [Bacillus sp. V3B]|uniref:hypothetical protein n=1 Tax=Bacillus sp. V3B TaxID=2804915 RepID=UPI00210B66EB|nr:hypothetical protein [Bacillus sp. V3B]MCQ6277381.1 hypothetical protein [Bacillus sp. V3B]
MNVKELKMELIQINEAIDMINTMLQINNDPELEDRLEKLLEEKKQIVKRLESLQ